MWKLLGGVFIGWSLGSNDSANLFGTGVAAKVVRYRTAIVLISLFVVIGAVLEGYKNMDTVGAMSNLTPVTAFIAAFISELSAAVTVHLFTQVGVPVSTSQAIVGGVTGMGIIKSVSTVKKKTLIEIAIGWVTTPISSSLLVYVLMRLYIALTGAST